MNARTTLPALLLLAACTPSDAGGETESASGSTTMSETTGGDVPKLELDAPCDFGPEDAAELALLTNDFSAAGLHRVDPTSRAVSTEVTAASTDTVLGAHGDWLVMVHRFGFNRVEVLDRGADWASIGGVDVTHPSTPDPNPQSVAFTPGGLAWVPLFSAPAVQVYDFNRDPADWLVGTVDLSGVADGDGNPEAGVALACGGTLFVGVQRLAPDYTPVDLSYLVPIDAAARAVIDLDPAADGTQAIALLGPWPKQFRRDPADAAGHTALVLTSGVERVDLSQGTSLWVIAPELLAPLGSPLAFVLAGDGASAYVALTSPDYTSVAVVHVGLDGGEPAAPVTIATTPGVGGGMLERLGGTLWLGDRDGARLRAFDLAQSPPAEIESDMLATTIPPWSFIPLP